jgi:hypothetical protein
MSFLPPDYDPPKSGGNYMKFQDGENKFRILSPPILGWEDWKDKKPYRFPMNEKPDAPMVHGEKIKHFWAFLVWNYSEDVVQILQIVQKSVQDGIRSLTQDDDWGDPYGYDIKVTKKGKGLDTEYSVNPVPHKKISKEIQDAVDAKPCDLKALFTGDDPFDMSLSDLFKS